MELKDSTASVSSNPAVAPCPKAKKTEEKKSPVPVDKVTIQCVHAPRDIKNFVGAIELLPDLPKGLAVTNKSTDTLTITITGPNTSPSLRVSPAIGEVKGPGTYKVPLYFEHLPNTPTGTSFVPLLHMFKDMGFYLAKQKETFTIGGFPPGFGSQSVIVYNPDQWSVSLKFPPIFNFVKTGKYEKGWKYKNKSEAGTGKYSSAETSQTTKEGYGRATLKESQSRHVQGTTSEAKLSESVSDGKKKTSEEVVEKKGPKPEDNKLDVTQNAVSADTPYKYFSVNKSGRLYEIEMTEIFDAVKNTIFLIDSFKTLLTSFKAGAYFDFELKKCFEGSITATFGYKEYNDHSVFFKYSVETQVLLLSAKFEAGVGVSAGALFNLQLFAYGELDFKLTGKAEKMAPTKDKNQNMEITITAAPSAKVGLGGRASAAFFASYEVKGATGLEAKLTFVLLGNPSFDLKGTFDFLGVSYTLKQSYGKSDAFGDARKANRKEKGTPEADLVVRTGLQEAMDNNLADPDVTTLLPKRNLGSFRLGDKYAPKNELRDDQILERLTVMLSESAGFFDYTGRIIVIRPKTERTDSFFTSLKGYLNYLASGGTVAIDMNQYDIVSDKEIAGMLIEKIRQSSSLDKSIEGINGLLTAIRNELRVLQGNIPGLPKGVFDDFCNRSLPNILANHSKIIVA